MKADVIVDLQYGDCAKGKVAHHLCRTRDYTHVLRYNGGCNAGHTIYHNDKKFITHHIPAGVFFGVRSVIGPGCVLDPVQFLKEIKELEEGGIDVAEGVRVAKNTHIITDQHKEEDGGEKKIGTTRRGNGPAYRDKYARTGVRAESVPELAPYLTDMYTELHEGEVRVLCEGAQGFGLDIDWGEYPYVTSSHCTVGGALINGVPFSSIQEVWGVAKIYETYVGAREFEPKDPIFERIRELGDEYGATTKRPRQCNWINLDLLCKAVRFNGVTHVVISKMDVLREVDVWKLYDGGEEKTFAGEEEMKEYITKALAECGVVPEQVFFSEHKDRI